MQWNVEILEATRHNRYRVAINGAQPLQERINKGKRHIGPKWYSNPLSQVADELIGQGVTEGNVYLFDTKTPCGLPRLRAGLNIAKRIELEKLRQEKRK